ncbi:MAG: DUF481 domain-containing protein [Deltaproteobacteria bacterium]|nr:DUF481 domain-containing protein [Deltaproteobacteria bacterium]
MTTPFRLTKIRHQLRCWRFEVILAGCCASLLASTAGGQVNTEKLRVGADQPGFGGHFDLTFALRNGNSDVLTLGSGFQVQYVVLPEDPAHQDSTLQEEVEVPSESPSIDSHQSDPAGNLEKKDAHRLVYEKQVLFLVSSYSFSEQNDERAVNSGFSHLRWGRNRGPRLGIEAFAQHQFNEFTNLDTRVLLGLGGRFALFRKPQKEAFLGSGYMFEFERLDVPVEGPDDLESRHHRWTNYISIKINTPDDRLLFVNTLYVQPRFDQPDDLRLLDEAELQIKITDRVSFGLSASLAHDSDPPEGIKETDITIVNRFRVKF